MERSVGKRKGEGRFRSRGGEAARRFSRQGWHGGGAARHVTECARAQGGGAAGGRGRGRQSALRVRERG
jgi:hypothetical protein